MLPYPLPTPFSPTQADLDCLAEALMESRREEAARKKQAAVEQAKKDAEIRRAGDLTAWDQSYSFRYRFRTFFSDPRMDVKNAVAASLVATVVISFRLLLIPFHLAALIIQFPLRPVKGAPAEGSTPANSGDAQPVVVTPLRLELGKIRSFNELAKCVAAYEQMIEGGNEREDDRTPEQKLMVKQYAEETLLGQCAQISHRLLDAERYAPVKRVASLAAAAKRRRLHFTGRCGVTFKHKLIKNFISPTRRGPLPAPTCDLDREALFTQWEKSVTLGEGLCPSTFSYEYHSLDGKPHTVRIVFDLARRTLRTTRLEVRHLARKIHNSFYAGPNEEDYLPDEEIGSFERKPSEKLWREFLDYLINERLDQSPVRLEEQPVRAVPWTLDVEFGDYEVHIGDNQTGPIGDKLSLMVGRLIA
jgi:hypothetical protein